MSMEMRVFFSGPLPSRQAVQQVMHDLGLLFGISDIHDALDDCSGFLPMTYKEKETGTEVYVGSAQKTIDELGIGGLDSSLNREISFRWGGDLMECASANALSMAIAKLTGGVIYDDSEGAVLPIDAALQITRSCLMSARET
jgi:hypothetical protein